MKAAAACRPALSGIRTIRILLDALPGLAGRDFAIHRVLFLLCCATWHAGYMHVGPNS